MTYVLVRFDPNTLAYQEIDSGQVQRYLDSDGVLLFVEPPSAVGCVVVDADPEILGWMV